jgi:hypothetical protein
MLANLCNLLFCTSSKSTQMMLVPPALQEVSEGMLDEKRWRSAGNVL